MVIHHTETGRGATRRNCPTFQTATYSMLATSDQDDLKPSRTSSAMESTIQIYRPAVSLQELEDVSGYNVEEPTCRQVCATLCTSTCSSERSLHKCKSSLSSFLPFIETMRTYSVKFILSDIIAGLSVAIVHIPQGMGFALLAHVPAVYGLYASFWPPLIYFFFGASSHNSMGTMAVISLIIAAAVDREITMVAGCGETGTAADIAPTTVRMTTLDNVTLADTTLDSYYDGNTNDTIDCGKEKAAIAMSLTLLSGLIQFAMGLCRLGLVTIVMPAPFVSGFTTAAAFYIATSQIKHLFGINVANYNGFFRLPLTWVDICRNLIHTSIPTLIIAIVTLIILIALKEGINKRFAKKMFMPVPAELIAVVMGTLCSYLVNFEKKYDVFIIGEIPRGIPEPAVPSMGYAGNLVTDAIVVAILSFVISFSMADIFARKHGYSVDSNQELLAYGLVHTGSAFFHAFAGASAPPRCVVNEQAGARSRVSFLWSCALLLLVMLVLGPLFSSLPTAVLGCVIIVALFPMFQQFSQLQQLWRLSKADLFIWLVTWVATVILDIGVGLGIGIVSVLVSTVVLSRLTRGHRMEEATASDLLVPSDVHSNTRGHPGLVVFRFESTLYYASAQRFKSQLIAATFDPRSRNEAMQQNDAGGTSRGGLEHGQTTDINESSLSTTYHNDVPTEHALPISNMEKEAPESTANTINTIIIDCSTFTFLDISGITTLQGVLTDFAAVDVAVMLAAPSHRARLKLAQAGLIAGEDAVPIYPTVQDAVACWADRHADGSRDSNTRL